MNLRKHTINTLTTLKVRIFILTLLLFTTESFSQGVVIISQYYEGASFDKWLEITNVGDATLDLTSPQLYLCLFTNTSADDPTNATPNNVYQLTGNLTAGQILIFNNTSAVNPSYAIGSNISVCNFNGDDLVIISTSGNTTDNGVAWDNRVDVIGDGTSWGQDLSFSRKITAISPSTSFNLSDWEQYTNSAVDNASSGVNERLGEFTGYTELPVELTSFTALKRNNGIELNWRTETEVNNYGFEIERKSLSPIPSQREGDYGTPLWGEWGAVGFVDGHGNSNSPKEYSFVDNNIQTGKYSYRLKQIDNDGTFEYSKVIDVDANAVMQYKLEQNFPNPFNPTTAIKFSIPVSGMVNIKVFNILGQEVAVLLNQQLEAGDHSVNFDASGFDSGIYFYRIEAGNFIKINKMTLLK